MLQILLAGAIFGATLFATIALVDRHHTRNHIGVALLIGLILAVFGAVAGPFGFLPLIALYFLLTSYYDFGLVQAAIVIGVQWVVLEGVEVALSALQA